MTSSNIRKVNNMSREVKEHGYATYPRRFMGYKWYKPILFAFIMAAIALSFISVLSFIAGVFSQDPNFISNVQKGYDGMDVYTLSGCLIQLGALASFIPAIKITSLIINDRPFSSYSSSRGGWNWKIFGKMMLVAFVVCGVPNIILVIVDGKTGVNRFTVVGFIALTLLGPLQCVAEEYLFRSVIMQTIGSWFKLPILGLIFSTVIFLMLHPYNIIGVIAVGISGLGMGITVLLTKGVEASSAVHIANNMVAFYASGLGWGAIKSEVDVRDIIVDVLVYVIYIGFIVYADKKLHWFDEVKKDDVEIYNKKAQEKLDRKAKNSIVA